jgi:hypothetical protein
MESCPTCARNSASSCDGAENAGQVVGADTSPLSASQISKSGPPMDIVRFNQLIKAAEIAIACVLAITSLPGCKFDVSMGATNEPLDARLLGEWEDPEANEGETAKLRMIVSEIPGQNRYKIALADGEKKFEYEAYRVDLPFPGVRKDEAEAVRWFRKAAVIRTMLRRNFIWAGAMPMD